MTDSKKIFQLGIINSNDPTEKVYYYQVCAHTEKQARYFLGKHLDGYFTENYNNVSFLKNKYNCNIFVIVDKQITYASKEYIGEINLV